MDSQRIFKKIDTFIGQHNLLPDKSKVIVGLSGGPDSVFLLHLLHRYQKSKQLTLISAHLNHEWRPEANEDAQFCKQLAESLPNIIFINKNASELNFDLKANGSKEALGRKMRRFFFESLLQEYNADYIALGHHADDQMETFFIRLIRGSQLAGLIGMKPKNKRYIRPLLAISKTEIINCLNEQKINYVVDSTNQSDTFLRNRIRNEAIPALKQTDERFENQFQRTLENLHETESFLESLTIETFGEITTSHDQVWHINIEQWKSLNIFLQRRILLHWIIQHKVPFMLTESFIEEMMTFLHKSHKNAHTIHHEWYLLKNQETFSLLKVTPNEHAADKHSAHL